MAEYTIGTILLSLKRVFAYNTLLKSERKWERSLPIAGAFRSRVGLLSLGAIGGRVASLLKPLDLQVLAYDPYVEAQSAASLGVIPASIEELFRTCDVVSIHTPWLPETEKLVNQPLLQSMKPGATLINTSRGAIVDEEALIAVLRERPDLTAILDVTHPEPPAADSPLWTLPNVLLTPHIAGSCGGEIARMGASMVDELLRYLDSKPLQHRVDAAMVERMA